MKKSNKTIQRLFLALPLLLASVLAGLAQDFDHVYTKDADAGLTIGIIAHRGYWDKAGSAQNSASSLSNAIELSAYGSETDVFITTDGVAVINHDPTISEVSIEDNTYAQVKDLTLSNGEKLPTLEQFLDTVKIHQTTKLIIEIKTHSNGINNDRVVDEVYRLVTEKGVQHLVDYIAFSAHVCERLIQKNPANRVAYLNGDKTPQQLKADGYWGFDYNQNILKEHPEWITQAKELGLTTNVWTVNDIADLKYFISAGVDYITTDNPVVGFSTQKKI
jgi:glycerophosphoryl diester phosphodiesterase